MSTTTGPTPGPTPAPARRTRPPDLMTNVMLVVTGIFGVWAIALIVLTFVGITQPSFLYSDAKAGIKALGATVVVVLSLAQLYTMESAMGNLPRRGLKMKYLMRTHRWSGRIAILLAALIAFFCLVDVGAPRSPERAFIHGLFGSTAFVALGVKFALLRFRPALAYDAAPWLGRYVVVAFIVIWLTSSFAYFTGQL